MQEIKSVIRSEVKSDWSFLLQPGILKAVLIGAAIAILGQFMGVNAVLYYGPTIFEEAGLSGGDALFSQVLVGVVNAVTTVIAVFIIDKVGRKKLVYYGVSGMILSLLLIGFYFSFAETLNLPNNFLLFFFLFYVLCSHFCTAFGNVSYPYSWDGNVSSRMFLMGRYLSCRTTDTMDASESYPRWDILVVCCDVYTLSSDCLEIDS